MTRLKHHLLAALCLLVPAFVHGQVVEFGNVNVVQNDSANNATSITTSKAPGSSPNFSVAGGSRGDYDVNFGTPNDVTGGVMISCVTQNGRDNTAQGDTIGLFYASSMVDWVGGGFPGRYWIPVARCAQGDEVNINVACGWFSYNSWLGGFARNSTATNGGANDTLAASPGINLGTQFVDKGGGVSTVNLTSLGASSANGILLVSSAKNEDNYALSQANADGTFTVWSHDNGVDKGTYEQDPVAFVYLPVSAVGTKQLVAIGRVNSNATTDIAGGNFTLTKGGTGQWYLTIPGQNNTTGVLLISPEGGGVNTLDNVVSYQWDAANNRWVIESRDLSGATALPTLQDGGSATEDMFSFAFFQAPASPTVAITAPANGSGSVAPATFTVTASASYSGGTVAKVDFQRNGVTVGTATTAPYSYSEMALPAGTYSYVAVATANDGAVGYSAPVIFNVGFDPNHIPANTALRFDGVNDYVTMGVAPELGAGGPPNNGMTLECWFRKEGAGITSTSGSGGVSGVPLFGKGRGESDGSNVDCDYFFGINSAGQLVADFETYPATGLTSGQNYPITATNAPIQDNVWYHAAVTYDGATATWKMYLNGVQVGTATAATGALPRYDSIQHFGIGAAFNSSGVAEGAFRGTIDEVRVWNYARSAADIAANKDKEIASGAGLIGRFGLNEGAGLTTASSTAATVGTLTNGPVWVDGAPFATANNSPSVALTAPVDGTTSYMPSPVTFTATASDSDGSIAKVQFLVNGTVVAEQTTAPYSFSWTPLAIADYAISARAVDNLGAGAVSAISTLHITPNPNKPPVVTPNLPADGTTIAGSTANLSVNLSDPESDSLTVTFYGRYTTPATPGPDFTIVAIPDTQYYSENIGRYSVNGSSGARATIFNAQTQWVLDNKAARNIAFVSHMGDLVQNGDNGGDDTEWRNATAAMGLLENPVNAARAYGVPWGAAPGNHDQSPNGDADGTTTFYNQYFPYTRYLGRDYWGGHYGTNNDNNYQLFSASGLDFIILHIEYDTTPNPAVLDWADALLKAYPNRRAIVTSHWIVNTGNPATFSTMGQALYDRLKGNPNFFLMMCGHIHGEGRRTDTYQGRNVYSILQDYQEATNGGNGFLRIYTFSPANNQITVESYSPTLNRAATTADLSTAEGTFVLPYNMQTAASDWVPLGTVTVPAGGTSASIDWTGLEAGKNFEWYAAVSDGVNSVGSASGKFATPTNTPPTVTLDSPANGATFSAPAVVNFSATASDADGSVARVEFYANSTKVGEATSAPYTASWSPQPGNYVLSAVAVDNSGVATLSNAANISVAFGDFPPTVTLTAPANGSVLAAPASVTLTADANDVEGPVAKVEFYSGNTLLGEKTTAPFNLPFSNLGAGIYTFTAKVTDSAGQSVTSAPITISVYTDSLAPYTGNVSVGLFNPPSWTIVQTSPAPHQFTNPGTVTGSFALCINGVSVPFASGIALCSNWNNSANSGITSDDNISQPYVDASGNTFVNVLDNSNNNAAGSNPSTTSQTAGTAAAFLSYADGWTGASVLANGTVLSGHLPAGVTVMKTITGTYKVAGLSTAGNMLAFTNGNTGTLADNVVSVRIEGSQWIIDTRDNAGGTQDNDFSFVYIPPATTGVYAGAINSDGTVSSPNASLSALGATVTVNSSYYEITFGDGSIINPTTATIFLVGDATNGGANSISVDNLISWSVSGNSFRIFTQDLPELNGTFEAIPLRFVAIPFAPIMLDSDGDGIPDEYEIAHGLDPHNAADALLDKDGDGISNRDEYLLGLNAETPDKYVWSQTINPGTGFITIAYPTIAGRSYRIWYSDDLNTWNPATGPVNGTGTSQIWTDNGSSTGGFPPATGRRFYQVRVTTL